MKNSNNKGDAVFNDIDEMLAKKIVKRSEVNNSDHDDTPLSKWDDKKQPLCPPKKCGWKIPAVLFALFLILVAVYAFFWSDASQK